MENISVYIRLRQSENKNDSIFSFDSKSITNSKTNDTLTFDNIFSAWQTNEEIFKSNNKTKYKFIIKRN